LLTNHAEDGGCGDILGLVADDLVGEVSDFKQAIVIDGDRNKMNVFIFGL
jgi:hypothetical protein